MSTVAGKDSEDTSGAPTSLTKNRRLQRGDIGSATPAAISQRPRNDQQSPKHEYAQIPNNLEQTSLGTNSFSGRSALNNGHGAQRFRCQ